MKARSKRPVKNLPGESAPYKGKSHRAPGGMAVGPMSALGARIHRAPEANGHSRKKKTAALRSEIAMCQAVAPAMREAARRERERV